MQDYLEMLRIEDQFTQCPTPWELSQAFPECRDIALRVAYDMTIGLQVYDESIKKSPLISEFMKADPRYKILTAAKKFLKLTKPTIDKDEIDVDKARNVPIETLFDLVKPRKTSRRITCCCPFHRDDHPSFVIYKDSNTFYCFSECKIGGDSIAFIQNLYGLSFIDAVKKLNNAR
jgi:hypothetical protein